MNTAFLMGFCVGLLIVMAGFLISWAVYKKSNGGKCQYDERQEMARGKAGKAGFITLVAYNMAYAICADLGLEWLKAPVAAFVGVFIAMTVFAVYCIWKDAYLSLNEKPKTVIIILSVVGGLNLLIGFDNVVSGRVIENGEVTIHVMNLLLGIMMLILFAAFMLKQWSNRRTEE